MQNKYFCIMLIFAESKNVKFSDFCYIANYRYSDRIELSAGSVHMKHLSEKA